MVSGVSNFADKGRVTLENFGLCNLLFPTNEL